MAIAAPFTLAELEAAADLVARSMPPTPQYAWPLLAERAGCEVWVKHENHTPTGAFKVRGGLVHLAGLAAGTKPPGLISATRGNHGQSIPFAARRWGIPVTILVPHGNSVEKNRAMRALGAELIEHGADFDEARREAGRLAAERGLRFVPSFHPDLVRGVATYALELFRSAPELERVYVPIGMGSGICGVIHTRDLLGLKTKVIGVSAAEAPAMARSFVAGRPMPTNSARTFADGMATREPPSDALEVILKGAEAVVEVSEDEIAAAIRAIFEGTHNVAEGAGAAGFAALLKHRRANDRGPAAFVLSGGNIDRAVLAEVLAGRTPRV